jgi:hypothetical protein
MWRNLSCYLVTITMAKLLDERIRLPVIIFRIRPSRYTTKNRYTHTAAELHNMT